MFKTILMEWQKIKTKTMEKSIKVFFLSSLCWLRNSSSWLFKLVFEDVDCRRCCLLQVLLIVANSIVTNCIAVELLIFYESLMVADVEIFSRTSISSCWDRLQFQSALMPWRLDLKYSDTKVGNNDFDAI